MTFVKEYKSGQINIKRPNENKALFPAHQVTKINLMRAAAKIFFWKMYRDRYRQKFIVSIFLGHNNGVMSLN